ncbi:hypothetical protein AQPE_0232 [Aquipluma nitroreducens]|uniref:Uncharacterized protein n=1 Tax=Aquipluma nitroreducens TaxID=2010828 RepID=A0A5K7S3P7_9BACT|nr:hypothetical protein AQPE_0232 [Aquipluma nitroreducens]
MYTLDFSGMRKYLCAKLSKSKKLKNRNIEPRKALMNK